jgi:hypothetical protein
MAPAFGAGRVQDLKGDALGLCRTALQHMGGKVERGRAGGRRTHV